MKIRIPKFLPFAICAVVLISALSGYAALKTFSAVSPSAWNVAGNWTPAGIPASGDDVIIPAGTACNGLGSGPQACASLSVGGAITLNGFAFAVSGSTIVSNAATLTINSTTGTRTFGDITVQSGGLFNGIANGNLGTISGNVTVDGSWNAYSAGQSTVFTLSGANKMIAGAGIYSNQSVTVSGTYTIQPGVQFYLGQNSAGSGHLSGTGALTNQGTIFYRCSPSSPGPAPEIATLDCSTVGNTFTWTNVNTTITPRAIAYYNLTLGNNGTSGANLNGSGLSIANNFALVGSGNISSWPVNGSLAGTFTYATSATSASTLPTIFSVGGLNQSGGKLTLPANGTLTVTGTGSGAWTITAGTFSQSSSSTVKFTGSAPVIAGNITNGFANLIIDSTATSASVVAPFTVTNALIVNSGGSLDVTALTTYTLSISQSVISAGTIVGSIGTAANSKAGVYAETNGVYGTNSITGSLALNGTNSVNLDVNSTAAAANDLLAVGGTLTLNNTVFNLKAPGAGASIDTANDYTLATAGSISGTPVLNWVTGFVPANSANYSLVVSGGTIKLHYSAVINPAPVIMSIVPNFGSTNGGTLVTINGANFLSNPAVTFGALPANAITYVNSSQITVTTPAHAPGPVTVTVTDTDAQTATGSYTYILPPPPATGAMALTGLNATMLWTGGTNVICLLLSNTNLTAPLSNWTVVGTNVVGANGLSTNVVPVDPSQPEVFYQLAIPYN